MLIRTQIMMPEDVYDGLKMEAALRQTSMSKLVVEAIGASVIKGKKKMGGIDALNKLVNRAYKGKNVPSDLSTNDNYLYGNK